MILGGELCVPLKAQITLSLSTFLGTPTAVGSKNSGFGCHDEYIPRRADDFSSSVAMLQEIPTFYVRAKLLVALPLLVRRLHFRIQPS